MTTPRRLGAEDSKTRLALLDAAQQLMLEEGYAAVTTRRVAARAGLKPQLIHYYFRTMDDLFLAMVQRGAEQNLRHQARVLSSPQPLRALWKTFNDPTAAALTIELTALANHRKAIKTQLGAYGEEFRRQQVEALSSVLEGYGIDGEAFPPAALLTLLTSVSRLAVMEKNLGMHTGHEEVLALVERYLTRLEGPAAAPGAGPDPEGVTAPSGRPLPTAPED